MQAHHGRSPGLISRTPHPVPPGAAAGLDAAASSLAGVAFFGVLLSCVSRLFSVVSRAFFLLFHGSHTIAAARTPFGPGPLPRASRPTHCCPLRSCRSIEIQQNVFSYYMGDGGWEGGRERGKGQAGAVDERAPDRGGRCSREGPCPLLHPHAARPVAVDSVTLHQPARTNPRDSLFGQGGRCICNRGGAYPREVVRCLPAAGL